MHEVDRPVPLLPDPLRDPDLPRPPVLPRARDWPHTDLRGLPRPPVDDPTRHAAASGAPYVDVTTGDLVLHDVDVALPGVLPLLLTRTHRSSWDEPSWFGQRWCSLLDECLHVDGDDVTWVRADATRLRLRLPEVGRATRSEEGDVVALRLTETGDLVLLDPSTAVERHFLTGGTRRPLAAVIDRPGHRLSIVRDATGTPVEVRHTGGYRVLVESLAGRVTALRVAAPQRPGPDERWSGGGVGVQPGVEVRRFEHDAQGRLAAVVVPVSDDLVLRADLTTDDDGRLVALRGDVVGGEVSAEHDGAGRCVRLDGPGPVQLAYVHDDGRLRRTTTDATTWVLDDAERPATITGADDVELAFDARDRLVARTDAAGTSTWSYDASGRIVAEGGPPGADGERRWTHHEPLGAEPAKVQGPGEGAWRQDLDSLGRARSTTAPDGATTARAVDPTARTTRTTRPSGGQLVTTCDAAGLPRAEERPDGSRWTWRRDERGRVVEAVDAAGERWRATWGPLGETSWTPPGRGTGTRTWRRGPDGQVEVVEVDADGHETVRPHTAETSEEPAGVPPAPGGHGDLDITWHTGSSGHPGHAEVAGDGQVVATLFLERDPCGRVRRLALREGAAIDLLRDPDGRVAAQSVAPPADEVALTGMALLEARLAGADAPTGDGTADVSGGVRTPLERRWSWSPAGRLQATEQETRATEVTSSAGRDGRVGVVTVDGRPVLRVQVVGDRVDTRLALVGPDGRPWAVVSGDGQALWVAGSADTAASGWTEAWGTDA